MKRLIFTLIVLALMATPIMAVPSLGPWDEYDPGTTHQFWEFDVASRQYDPIEEPAGGDTSVPDDVYNPYGLPELHLFGWDWDGSDGWEATDSGDLRFVIPNRPFVDGYKDVYIELGIVGDISSANAISYDYDEQGLPYIIGETAGVINGNTIYFHIEPNPQKEDIDIEIIAASGTGGNIYLDWAHVDTICIPAPGAIILGSLGVGLVGWLRRRKSL